MSLKSLKTKNDHLSWVESKCNRDGARDVIHRERRVFQSSFQCALRNASAFIMCLRWQTEHVSNEKPIMCQNSKLPIQYLLSKKNKIAFFQGLEVTICPNPSKVTYINFECFQKQEPLLYLLKLSNCKLFSY